MPRKSTSSSHLLRRFIIAAVAILAVVLIGSAGYWLLGGRRESLGNCLYMTVITITTVGFGEVINVAGMPGGRVLTMLIAVSGIGAATYLLSSLTAFVVEGELTEAFRRRKMEKKARHLSGHYLICGLGQVGRHIVHELRATQRPCIVIDRDAASLADLAGSIDDLIYFEGDATDNDILLAAGIQRASGVFAATNDDNHNLVISLTAKQLNPNLTVVARCGEVKNAEKMKAAGADSVISPAFIGGLRMASEMLRPTVVSFLDLMLRDREKNLRIEEIPAAHVGKTIAELGLDEFRETLLLAVRTGQGWAYNPPASHVLDAESRLVVMTTPRERAELERRFGNSEDASFARQVNGSAV